MARSLTYSNYSLRVFFCFLFYCFSATICFAQVSATAELDTNVIKLGDQINVTLYIQYSNDKGKTNITWPLIKDTIAKNIELVSKAKLDTSIDTTTNTSIIKQKLTITSFDSGYYVIPPFAFLYQAGADTNHYKLETEPLLLKVKTIPVDTTKEFKDIKPPLDVPFSLEEALPYILGGLAVIVVGFLIYWLIKKFRKRKTIEVVTSKPTRPAHEIALEALEALEKEKLWQQGNYKLYHSTLSDIVRTYIEHRYDIMAMELPTDETLVSLRTRLGSPIMKEKLREMLVLADLVKFAKNQPLGVENEMSLKNAYDFINATKLVATISPEGKEEVKE